MIKHGPGSVGHNAKILAIMFTGLKGKYPNYSNDQLFKELLKWRMSKPYKLFTSKELTDEEINGLVRAAEGKLSKLILELSHWERPVLDNLAIDDMDKYIDVMKAIEEIVKKYAPSGDDILKKAGYEINREVAKKYGIDKGEISGKIIQNKPKGLPKTVDEAVDEIIATFPRDVLEKLASMTEEDLIECHFGLGLWIRNNFGLWKGNKALLEDAGSDIPDTASMTIIRTVWQKLRDNHTP